MAQTSKADEWGVSDDEADDLVESWIGDKDRPASVVPVEPVARRIRTMLELLEEPGLLQPPRPVVPKLAWEGRVTLLAAREKAGKSTLASAAVAALSAGDWLFGTRLTPGKVLLLSLEEHVGDVVRRLRRFAAQPGCVFILEHLVRPLEDLEAAVAELRPALVVIDTLPAFVEMLAPESGSSSMWTPIMSAIARTAHESGAAIILLHHADKMHGKYRDSTAIGAGVDVILEMKPGTDPSIRRVASRGRFRVDEFAWRLVEDGPSSHVELATGELSLDAQILLYIERSPGCSLRSIRTAAEGAAVTEIDVAVHRLEARGAIHNTGTATRHAWEALRVAENPQRHASDTVPTHSRHAQEAGPAVGVSRGGSPPQGGSPPDTTAHLHMDTATPWTTHELFERETNRQENA